jgi:hypothetical protein
MVRENIGRKEGLRNSSSGKEIFHYFGGRRSSI